MKSALNKIHLRHMLCVARTLNRVVGDAVRDTEGVAVLLTRCSDLMAHFKHSAVASGILRSIQNQTQMSRLKLIQQVPTRWNSRLSMVQHLLEVKTSLILA